MSCDGEMSSRTPDLSAELTGDVSDSTPLLSGWGESVSALSVTTAASAVFPAGVLTAQEALPARGHAVTEGYVCLAADSVCSCLAPPTEAGDAGVGAAAASDRAPCSAGSSECIGESCGDARPLWLCSRIAVHGFALWCGESFAPRESTELAAEGESPSSTARAGGVAWVVSLVFVLEMSSVEVPFPAVLKKDLSMDWPAIRVCDDLARLPALGACDPPVSAHNTPWQQMPESAVRTRQYRRCNSVDILGAIERRGRAAWAARECTSRGSASGEPRPI